MYSLISWPGFSRKRYDSVLGNFDRWLTEFEEALSWQEEKGSPSESRLSDLKREFQTAGKEIVSSSSAGKSDDYHIKLPLPGFTKEEVKVEIEENTLSIKAESKEYGKVSEVYSLSKRVDRDKIECNMKDGLLKIKIPSKEKKVENKYKREIELKT